VPYEGPQSHRLGWLGTIEAEFANYVAQWRPGRQRLRVKPRSTPANPITFEPNDSPALRNLLDAAAAVGVCAGPAAGGVLEHAASTVEAIVIAAKSFARFLWCLGAAPMAVTRTSGALVSAVGLVSHTK
jgi:hypothetical protein